MFFREWCFGTGRPQEIDTGKELIGIDHAERDKTPPRSSVTTSSDVYSLGVILYVLLTGRRPYHVSSTAPHEILKAICDTDPEKPSTAVSRAEKPEKAINSDSAADVRVGTEPKVKREKLTRELAGDLDNIVLKALRKEPERRYTTVEQFSEDVRHHLENLPVIARKDTPRYRASKFVLRHKVGVAAAVIFSVLLSGALGFALREARITRANELRAERRFNDVRALASSLMACEAQGAIGVFLSVPDVFAESPAGFRAAASAGQA